MTNFQFTRRDFFSIAILAWVVVVWFYPFFTEGAILLPPNANSTYPWYETPAFEEAHPQGSMDAVRENYITWALTHRYIRERDLPHWQPYFLSGNPLLANQFAIPYSPYKLLNVFFSAPVAWSWAIILKCFFNGLFAYLSLRALNRSYTAATIGALAWMLSWPLAHQTQTTYNEGVAWLPAVFFLTLRSYQVITLRQKLIYLIPAVLVAGFQYLAGNIQMTLYCAILLGGFAVYWAWDQNRHTATWLGRVSPVYSIILVYLAGLLVGAVQLGSSAELLDLSIRGVSQTHVSKGIEPYTEITLFNPWLYYWRNFEFPELREKYWLNYRWNPYIGLLPLFLCGVTAFFSKERVARAILYITAGVFLVLHVVYWRPVFNIVSQLPAYSAVDQTRFLIVLMFPLAILAAYGVDWLLEHGQTHRRLVSRWLGAGAVILAGAGVAFLALMNFFQGELDATHSLGDSFADQRIKIGTQLLADYYHLQNPLFALTFIWGIGSLVLLTAYIWGKIPRRMMEAAMILLVAADLVIFARVNVGTTPPDKVYPVTPAIQFLQDKLGEGELFRIHAAQNTLFQGREDDPTSPYHTYRADHSWFMAGLMPPLMPNTPALFGLQDVRGYESVYTLDYSRAMATMDGQADPFSAVVTPETVTHPMLDMLNVGYVLAVEPLNEPNLNLVYTGEVYIYENLNVLPRVMLYDNFTLLDSPADVLETMTDGDFDPRTDLYFSAADYPPSFKPAGEQAGTATITTYEPNRVVIQTQTEQPSLLVLADKNYPDWRATIDGDVAPIYTANYLLRAIELPAGAHQVEFRYESRVIRWGGWVSALSSLFLWYGWLGLMVVNVGKKSHAN